MNILEVNISSDTKTTKLMDNIFNPENNFSRVIFRNLFAAQRGYLVDLVCDLRKKIKPYDWDIPHYYYTMTRIKNGLYPDYAYVKNITEIHDYGMEDEVAYYMTSDTVETDKIILFNGDYSIHGQRTQDYKAGGWGNYENPKLYAVGFVVRECK